MGLIVGFVGRGFSLSGWQQPLSIAIGSVMILLVIFPKIGALQKFTGKFTMGVGKIKSALGLYLKKKSYKALFITGLINGLLPCGLVYMALLGALGMTTALRGGLFMVLFGLGTFPLMFLIGALGNVISPKFRMRFQKVIPVLVFVIGVLFVLRGLGLGIKYISPPTQSLTIDATEQCH